MANAETPSEHPRVTREKLLQYRAGCLSEAEKEEIRQAVSQDPRLAACCQEEESLDKCIERCCKQESASGDLKARIRACLQESAAASVAASATATAKKIVPQYSPEAAAAATPEVRTGRVLSRMAMVAAAAMLLTVGGAWLVTSQSPTRLTPIARTPEPGEHPAHQANNPLDTLVAEYEAQPRGTLPSETQVISIVQKVGLNRPPHGPNVRKLVSVGHVDCPFGKQVSRGVKVCFECPGNQSWNLSVLCVSPELLAALHQHDSLRSPATKRVYYMCGDSTGRRPCAVFWEEDGKIMVLVAQQPPKHLIEMADGLEF